MAENKKLDGKAAPESQPQFTLQSIYVKDISFETPNSPDIFSLEWKPEVNMHLSSEARGIGQNMTEVVLSVTVTTKLGEKTAYLVETSVAGIFVLEHIPEEMIERMVATICPNMLFPFARELVSNLVTRGGFPQLLLAPVNFDALYQHQKQEESKTASEKTDGQIRH